MDLLFAPIGPMVESLQVVASPAYTLSELVPATLTWTAVAADVQSMIATSIVIGIVAFVMGVRIVPKFIRMLKSIAR